jgi:hypothetical protein
MSLYYEQSCHLIRFPRYYQVLTGVLPYDISIFDVAVCISSGKKPSRPTGPTQNQWLHDPVWDMITTCWSDKPKRRCKLSVVHHVFSTSTSQTAEPDDPGDMNVQIERNDDQMVPNVETGLRQRGKLLPRIASLFPFLSGSEPEIEPEIERSVDEMDKAGLSAFPSHPIPTLTRTVAS